MWFSQQQVHGGVALVSKSLCANQQLPCLLAAVSSATGRTLSTRLLFVAAEVTADATS